MDDMSLVYNINLCRICQIPEHLDLVKTDTTSGNGDTYLEQLKFIFEDIFWIEDELISLACKTCLEKVTDIAEFKRLCLETNGRRGALTFDPVKVEHVAIKVEDNQAVAEQADDGPEVEAAPQHRAKRKLSISEDDLSLQELKSPNDRRKRKRKQNESVSDLEDCLVERSKVRRKRKRTRKVSTSVKAKDKCNTKKNINTIENLEKSYHESEDNAGLDDVDENTETGNVTDENTNANSELAKVKASKYLLEYKPEDDERNCRICKMEFSSLKKLKAHISAYHIKIRYNKYPCQICPDIFNYLDQFERHMFRHDGTRTYICPYCGNKFITNGDLIRHKKRHKDAREYFCELCPDKKYKARGDLTTHKFIVHTDPKDYKHLCTECGTKFPTSGALKIHILRHNNIRNFACHICDKAFYTNTELVRHSTSHTNVRPFKCDMCPAEYKLKEILLRHKTRCHGIGNYKLEVVEKKNCGFCGKTISSKEKLVRHMRTHTGVRPYKCRLCNHKFICKSYVKGHVKSKHDVDVDSLDFKSSSYYDVCEEELARDGATSAAVEPTDGVSNKATK